MSAAPSAKKRGERPPGRGRSECGDSGLKSGLRYPRAEGKGWRQCTGSKWAGKSVVPREMRESVTAWGRVATRLLLLVGCPFVPAVPLG